MTLAQKQMQTNLLPMRNCCGTLVLILLVLGQIGCSASGPESTNLLSFESKIPVGGKGFLNVKVKDRANIAGPVTLTLESLPAGVEVTDGKRSVLLEKIDQAKATFHLKASEQIPEGKSHKGTIRLKSPDRDELVPFELTIRNFQLDTTGGMMMGISICAVLLLIGFSTWRVLTLPPVEIEEHLKGPLEIDTGDTENAD